MVVPLTKVQCSDSFALGTTTEKVAFTIGRTAHLAGGDPSGRVAPFVVPLHQRLIADD